MKRRHSRKKKKDSKIDERRDKRAERIIYLIIAIIAILFLAMGYFMFREISDWEDHDKIESPLIKN